MSFGHFAWKNAKMYLRQRNMFPRHLNMSGKHLIFQIFFCTFHHLFLVEKSVSTIYVLPPSIVPPFLIIQKKCTLSGRHIKMSGKHIKMSERHLATSLLVLVRYLGDMLRCPGGILAFFLSKMSEKHVQMSGGHVKYAVWEICGRHVKMSGKYLGIFFRQCVLFFFRQNVWAICSDVWVTFFLRARCLRNILKSMGDILIFFRQDVWEVY